MKYKASLYAKALAEVVMDPKAQSEEVVENFMLLLERTGDGSHAEKIVEEAARLTRGKSGFRDVAIESARGLTPKQRKEFSTFIRPTDVVHEEIVPGLIAGVRIIVNDELMFDGSLSHKLNSIFED